MRSVNWLGDAVMSTPALLRLRQARPAARITLLSPEKLAGLWEGQPFLGRVAHVFRLGKHLEVGRRLREKRFTTGRGLSQFHPVRAGVVAGRHSLNASAPAGPDGHYS